MPPRKSKTTDQSSAAIDAELSKVKLEDNISDEKLSSTLLRESEGAYTGITSDIVTASTKQLKRQNDSKNSLKKTFTTFFVVFISVQFIVMIVLLLAQGACPKFMLSDTIILTYITTVFIETLGAIVLMIRYAFDSAQEVEILNILNGVISNYQKFDKK